MLAFVTVAAASILFTPYGAAAGSGADGPPAVSGSLSVDGLPISDYCDFQVSVWDAAQGGQLIAEPVLIAGVEVNLGQFELRMEPLSPALQAAGGQPTWIELSVAYPSGSGEFSTLTPRRPVGVSPAAAPAAGDEPQPEPRSVPGDGNGAGGTAAWMLDGNAATDPQFDFIGTVDNKPLALRVNNERGLCIEPGSTPNLIGGHAHNIVTPGRIGATISGGGAADAERNAVLGDFGAVGGGAANTAGREYATIGGGRFNSVTAPFGTIGGGGPSDLNAAATTSNRVVDSFGTVGGGAENQAGGGDVNSVDDARYATVGGGQGNLAEGRHSSVGGGYYNDARGNFSTIAGGAANGALGAYASVAGGGPLGAGGPNIAADNYTTVGGGTDNIAGLLNDVTSDGVYATVGGGRGNTASQESATVAGGRDNDADGRYSFVGGGRGNRASGDFATIAGGGNTSPNNSLTANQVLDNYGAIGGGGNNKVGGGDPSNLFDRQYGTIAGGQDNVASGAYAAIAGGRANLAAGDYSFAVGRRAKIADAHDGSVLISDGRDFDFNSTGANEFALRATGGVRLVTAIDAATGAPKSGVNIAPGANAFGALSDRGAKENFAPVNALDILAKVAALPIESWNYKTQSPSIRHMGPMSADFYTAFAVGEDDMHISTIDADGVALAAIQGLNTLLQQGAADVAHLEQLIAQHQAALDSLNAMLQEYGADLSELDQLAHQTDAALAALSQTVQQQAGLLSTVQQLATQQGAQIAALQQSSQDQAAEIAALKQQAQAQGIELAAVRQVNDRQSRLIDVLDRRVRILERLLGLKGPGSAGPSDDLEP
jgi:hypothetical protein